MNIAQLLHHSAAIFPDAPAISFGEDLVHRYSGLQHRVGALAAGLLALPGVQSGDRIALAMKNSPEYLELMWAVWHAGLCLVPMNAKLHPKEFAFILKNCGVRVCFASSSLAQPLAVELQSDEASKTLVIDADSADYAKLASFEPTALQPSQPEAPAWLFYTSGTTGRPKGATISHRALLAMSLRYYADIDLVGRSDCMIHMAPLSHATGLYSLPHIAKGSHQIIPASQGFDPGELCTLLETHSNVAFFAAPTMMTRLVNTPGIKSANTDHIKTIVYGGAPMYLENLKSAMNTLGPCLMQLYGQGESPNTITCVTKEMHTDTEHPRYEERLASVGVARTGVEVRVVDDTGDSVPAGEIGEIICRSDVSMSGYWNNPQATETSLRDGWLHTGDLGAFDQDGFLTLKDRSKDVIISGGSNIYPREVEEVLLQHDDVLEVSVVGRAHADWGEEVIAFVAAKPGRQVTDDALNELCLRNIGRFKRPKQYIYIEELPKNSYGKILKTALRDLL
ncbi:MAG: AMP-binding protein [Burkholderiaceae bacterium]